MTIRISTAFFASQAHFPRRAIPPESRAPQSDTPGPMPPWEAHCTYFSPTRFAGIRRSGRPRGRRSPPDAHTPGPGAVDARAGRRSVSPARTKITSDGCGASTTSNRPASAANIHQAPDHQNNCDPKSLFASYFSRTIPSQTIASSIQARYYGTHGCLAKAAASSRLHDKIESLSCFLPSLYSGKFHDDLLCRRYIL